MHADHVDVVAQLRDLLSDGHDLVESPHALPGFEVGEVLVDFFEACVEILHGAVIVVNVFAGRLPIEGGRDFLKAFVGVVLTRPTLSNLVRQVPVRLDDIPLRPNDDA